MTDKRPRDQGKKTNKTLSFTTENRYETEEVMEVVKTDDIHTYANSDGGVVPLPESALCTPVAKKAKWNLHSPNCKITL